MGQTAVAREAYVPNDAYTKAAEDKATYTTKTDLEKAINKTQSAMEKAAKDLNFVEAAKLRDQMFALKEELGNK